MQYVESSVIGLRSAVFTLARLATPLRFVVFPMVHVAEPDFYRQVAERAGECDLIVAEGAPVRRRNGCQESGGIIWSMIVHPGSSS